MEKMHTTASLTKWYEKHGKHEIFAGGKNVGLDTVNHSLVLREELITNEIQHDLDNLGIAKTAREEKSRARDAKLNEAAKTDDRLKDAAYHAQMAKMYRQVVLKEKPAPEGFVPLGTIGPMAPAGKPIEKKNEEVGAFGD